MVRAACCRATRFQSQERTDRGFSLIEVSICLMLIGLLLVPLILVYKQYLETRRIAQSRSVISIVDSALIKYVAKFGRYPIPSSPNIQMGAAGFGQSATMPATDWPACSNPSGGVVCRTNVNSFGANDVLIGAVPFSEIGIPFVATIDGYGTRLTYAVTRSLTDVTTYNEGQGAIEVRNNAGVSRYFSDILPANGVDDGTVPRSHAIIISHGEDRRGGFQLGGQIAAPCTGAGRDIENCNNDGLFTNNADAVGNPFRSYGAGADHYDDFVLTNNIAASGIWTFIPTTPNMRTSVSGNVNIGACPIIPCIPKSHVDVNGSVRATEQIRTGRMCAYGEAACIDNFTASTFYPAQLGPDMLAGAPAASSLPETLSNWDTTRQAHTGAGIRCVGGRALSKISNNDETCLDTINFSSPSGVAIGTCPTGQFGKSLNAAGNIVCQIP